MLDWQRRKVKKYDIGQSRQCSHAALTERTRLPQCNWTRKPKWDYRRTMWFMNINLMIFLVKDFDNGCFYTNAMTFEYERFIHTPEQYTRCQGSSFINAMLELFIKSRERYKNYMLWLFCNLLINSTLHCEPVRHRRCKCMDATMTVTCMQLAVHTIRNLEEWCEMVSKKWWRERNKEKGISNNLKSSKTEMNNEFHGPEERRPGEHVKPRSLPLRVNATWLTTKGVSFAF